MSLYENLQKIRSIVLLWFRAIRIKFILASIIAVSNGIAISYWKTGSVDPGYALLTYFGIMCLHISVDLLNDYSDFKRGIDTSTKRTKYSGGTGVIPENLINPRLIYCVGLVFLILGGLTGLYFVTIDGVGPSLIRALALISQLIYGSKTSWEDPVQFSFAHGGKDGVPFPIDRNTFDRSIKFLSEAIEGGEISGEEKRTALKRLFSNLNSILPGYGQ